MAEPAQSPAGAIQGQDPNVVYALGSSPGESARLQRQADELADDSAALLDRVGLRPGQSVIDLGCGPQRNSMSWIRRPGLISRTPYGRDLRPALPYLGPQIGKPVRFIPVLR
jgi:hypothetical protein